MSGADISAAIGPPGNCGPYDTACIVCNTQQANAVSNLVDSGCIAPGTPISFTCDTSQDAINSFYSPNPTQPGATVGGNYIPAPAPVQSTGAAPYTAQAPTAAEIANCPSLIFYNGVCASPASPPAVVNPSPPAQSTNGSTTGANSGSATSQANGGASTTGNGTTAGSNLASTVQGFVSDLTSSTDLIPGVPNWVLLAGGVVILAALIEKKW